MHSSEPVPVAVRRLAHGAGLDLPAYATAGAAGMDVVSAEDVTISPGGRHAVATGLALAIPPGFEIQVRPRSGLALKHGVTVPNAPGTIDSDYRGELKVILINHGSEPFAIRRGDRVAQLVLAVREAEAQLANLLPPLMLDVMADAWPVPKADAVLCINMIHIAPWEATAALIRGVARVLPRDRILFLYGPFKQGGQHTTPSNAEFDASLRAQDARWGVRDIEAVTEIASAAGFAAPVVEAMPANNLSVIFCRLA